MSENMKICSNCDSEIPESKFILHEPYCLRNVKKCAICKEVIEINDEEEHIKENHTDLPCKFCKKGFPKQEIIGHMAKCDEKPAECKFCHLQISFKEKKDHEYICGSKTEYCSNCKKYIPMKDFEAHLDIQCYPDDTYLSNHLNVEIIPQIMKKRNSKLGKIAEAKKLGLMGKTEKKDEMPEEKKNIHNDLAKKIEALEKNKGNHHGSDKNVGSSHHNNVNSQNKANKINSLHNSNHVGGSHTNKDHIEVISNIDNYKEITKDYLHNPQVKTGNVVKAGNVKVSIGVNHNKIISNSIKPASNNNVKHQEKHTVKDNSKKVKEVTTPITSISQTKPLNSLNPGTNANHTSNTGHSDVSNNHIKLSTDHNVVPQQIKKMPYTKQVDKDKIKVEHITHSNNNKVNAKYHDLFTNKEKKNIKPYVVADKDKKIKKDKKNDKDKFDPTKYIEDYIPDEYIESQPDYYDLKYDSKRNEKKKSNIEDEVLRQVMELSKQHK